MIRRCLIATLFAWLAICGPAGAFDSVKTEKGTVPGRVVGMDSTKVLFQKTSADALSKEIPVNQIQTIFFDGEPRDLRIAKTHVLGGHYAEALAALERIAKEPVRVEIQQDIEFYKALCTTKLALGGSMKIAEAGRLMKDFADNNPKSYHYFEASEAVGDLLVAIAEYDQAADYYARLQNAPWPDFQMRGGVALGRALLDQEKTEQAAAAFDKVIATEVEGDAAARQRTAARVGKAGVLVKINKPDEAIKLIKKVIDETDPEDLPIMARAHNVLGAAERRVGHTFEAKLAFLWVDLIYSAQPDAHAEALANLVQLWEDDREMERANRAREMLKNRYPDSPWTKKLEE
ncbi:MAG: hypothetical protein JW959_09625 [Pirellulales bacterium]|nr:hypothetical protein [Pirellulales bacterium]